MDLTRYEFTSQWLLHFASLGRHFTDIHFHLVPGRIIPTTISSTITETLRCRGSHAGLLEGIDGCNFKILLKACFVSATPLDSALDGSELCFRLGQGQDQHLFEEVEHVGLFLKKATGKPRCVIRSLGTGGMFVNQIWEKRDFVALLPG